MNIYFYDKQKKLRIKKFDKIEKDNEIYYVQTKEWNDYVENKKRQILLDNSNLPSHVRGLTLDDYIGPDRDKIKKLKKYISEFETRYKGIHLYFYSLENGTQKTTIAGIVAKELLLSGFSVEFILMSSLLSMLSNEKFDSSNEEKLKRIRNCDFLIIDDAFDKKKATIYRSGYQIPFLDEFLRQRLEIDQKAICFSSNFAIVDIDEDVFGVSVKSLVKRSVKDPFLFESSYELVNDFDPNDLWS